MRLGKAGGVKNVFISIYRTGSGSFSHSIARTIAPSGTLYTFEYHKERQVLCDELLLTMLIDLKSIILIGTNGLTVAELFKANLLLKIILYLKY